MDALYQFDVRYLIPAALIGAAAAVILLILRRKRDGVRPPYATAFLIIALALFGFAAVTVILIPLIHLLIQFVQFALVFIWSALKSL